MADPVNHLVLLRHGQSQWNMENRFTGWHDVDLTDKGEAEARRAGELMKNIRFDAVYSSSLTRANRTAQIALRTMRDLGGDVAHLVDGDGFAMTRDQALNERDYGDLVGPNKAETAEKYGDEQVRLWRRDFATRPPGGESLADVVERVRPYFEQNIAPRVNAGENILVAAHGNSLRALLIALGEHAPEEIPSIELPTGAPLKFDFRSGEKLGSGYME